MNKQTYVIPEVGVQPLHLSACIMSGGGSEPAGLPIHIEPPVNGQYEARKRVY